jgi:CDP-paratose 2-epimerase
MEAFLRSPRVAGVYNIGGGRENIARILEAFALVECPTGKPMKWSYSEKNRDGDHICHYSDLTRIRTNHPDWDIAEDLCEISGVIIESWKDRLCQST